MLTNNQKDILNCWVCLHTKHNDCCRCTTSPSNNVAGQAGVISRVGQSCFIDDQVVVSSSVNIDIVKRTHQLFVLQPLNLQKEANLTDFVSKSRHFNESLLSIQLAEKQCNCETTSKMHPLVLEPIYNFHEEAVEVELPFFLATFSWTSQTSMRPFLTAYLKQTSPPHQLSQLKWRNIVK